MKDSAPRFAWPVAGTRPRGARQLEARSAKRAGDSTGGTTLLRIAQQARLDKAWRPIGRQGGSRSVTTTWQLGAPGDTYSGWEAIQIPNPAKLPWRERHSESSVNEERLSRLQTSVPLRADERR
jgi:hypothetical protein